MEWSDPSIATNRGQTSLRKMLDLSNNENLEQVFTMKVLVSLKLEIEPS